MATIRIDLEGRDQVSQNVQNLRGTLVQLNRTIAENKNALVGANAEERRRIQALNQANSAIKANISVEIQELNLKKQIIAATMRETRERERAARAAERQAEQSRQAALDLTQGVAVASGVAARQLGRLTTGFVQAAAEMETFRASLNAVTGDAAETDRILERLLDVSVELVGIDTGDLISFAARLMAAGLSADDAISSITGVTERIAEQGKSAAVTRRILEQVSQSINTGRARMDDFRPILAEMPRLWEDASNALGTNIQNLDDFNAAADASGGHTQALNRLLAEMARASEGADLSTLNAQLDVLNDQSRILQNELGTHLLPAITAIVKQINEWIEQFQGLDDETQKAIAYGAALATGLAALTAVVGGTVVALGALSASLAAITGTAGLGGVVSLAGQAAGGLGRVVGILGRLGSAGNLAATAGITLAQAWNQIYNDFQRTPPFEDAVESIEKLDLAASQTARSLGVTAETFSGVAAESVSNAQNLISRLDELRTSITNAVNRRDTAALEAYRNEYRQLSAQLEALLANLPQVATETSAVTESLETQFVRIGDQVIRLRDSFGELSGSEDIQAIETAASNLTAGLERELALQLMDAELTAADRLDLELSTQRAIEGVTREAQERITAITDANAEEQAEAVERQTAARIASAERARGAEVASNERAAASGAAYAEQLAMIASVSGRRAFVDLVETFQAQGLSFDEARTQAALFLPLLVSTSQTFTDADRQAGQFNSNLVRDANRSADAVLNLVGAVERLGTVLAESLPDTAGALERSAANEARYFQQNPVGRTIESDQQAAGEQGRAFVNRLFGRQDRDAQRDAQRAARESEQALNETIRNIDAGVLLVTDALSGLDGTLGDLAGTLSSIDFTALLSGNPFATVAEIGRLFVDLFQDVHARRQQVLRERAELERLVDRVIVNAAADERIQADFQQRGQVAIGIGRNASIDDAIVQSLYGTGLGNITPNLAVLEQAYDPFIQSLETAMEAAGNSLEHAIDQGFDETVISSRTADLAEATTAFYDIQIEEVRAAAALSMNDPRNAVFALVQERDAIINEATNLLRSRQPAGPQNAAQFRAATGFVGPTAGLTPGVDDQERGVVFDPNAAEQASEVAEAETLDAAEAAERARRIAEALQTRTSRRFAQEAIAELVEATNDVNATEITILEAWEETIPELENWWRELYDDILNNPDLTEAERGEDFAALGTQQDFVSRLKSQYVTPAINGIAQATEALQTRTANRVAQEAITALGEATGDVNATEAEILAQWEATRPALETWWRELYEDILNDPNLSDAQESESLAALGSQQDFVANIKAQYVTPAITGIRSSAEALQTRTANRLAQEALGSLSEAVSDVNITEAAVVSLWTAALPALENWYQELLDDANAIENDAERAEAIAALGTAEQFIANLKSQYVTPVISGIRNSAEALETRTANRLAQGALGALREAASDTNITESEILTLWQTAIPLIETWYQELLDDVNSIENDAERAEALTALGSPEQFVANLKSQYVTPVIMGIQRSTEALETRTANRIAQGALTGLRELAGDVNITEQAIADAWTAALPFIETWYQELLDDAEAIENIGDRTEALAALGSPEQFIANIKSQYVTPVLAGIAQSTEALETQTAGRLANDAIGAIGEAASDVNLTRQAIIGKWNEAVPFIRTWWQELHDDIVNNPNLSDARIAEDLAALGSVESFIGNIRSQYVTPVLNQILQTRFDQEQRVDSFAVRQARFSLGGATSESEFTNLFGVLATAINTFYDNEEARIQALGLSVEETAQLLAENDQSRHEELRALSNITNTFAEDRIQTEMRLLDDINDLRDDAIDNEADRLQAIENLNEDSARRREDIEEDHQERLRDIQLRSLRSREDIDREFGRDIEDILRDAGADTLLSPAELQNFLRTAQSPSATGLASEASRLGADLSEDDISSIQELARERLRDRQDIDTRSQRQRADAQNRVQQARAEEQARSSVRRAEIEENATATATAIETALTPLLEMQIGLSPETIAMQTETAALESMTAVMNSESAVMTNEASGRLLEVADEQETAVGMITLAAEELQSAARVQGLFDAASALQGAGFALVDVAQELSGVASSLAVVSNALLFAVEGFSEAVNDGTLLAGAASRAPSRAVEQMLEASPENPLAVEVTNPTEIYDPERIAALQEQGLNNREIGMLLRQEAAVMMPTDIESRMMMPATPTDFSTGTMNVTAGSVFLSGNVNLPTPELNLNLEVQPQDVVLNDQKVGQAVGDTIVKQNQQGRNLLGDD